MVDRLNLTTPPIPLSYPTPNNHIREDIQALQARLNTAIHRSTELSYSLARIQRCSYLITTTATTLAALTFSIYNFARNIFTR